MESMLNDELCMPYDLLIANKLSLNIMVDEIKYTTLVLHLQIANFVC